MVRRAYLIVFFFCIFLSFLPFLLRETHFPTDDLGRHITNGRVFLEGNTHILFQNVYSYTHTEYPFLNHHWLTGVVYAILDRQWGLPSLYLLNSVLLLCSYLFTMLHVRTKSDRILTLLFSIPIFMLFSYRPTIRPEVFGYFFLAYMTFRWSLVRKEQYWSWTESIFYSILMILWVNLHISFILGVFVLSMMMIDHRENLRNNKSHLLRFLLPMMVTILNPSTLLGMIYPLKMFFNYGYPIAENMTPFFMMQVQFDLRLFFAILLLIVAVVCLFFTAFQKNVARLSDWITVCTASRFCDSCSANSCRMDLSYSSYSFFCSTDAIFSVCFLRDLHGGGNAVYHCDWVWGGVPLRRVVACESATKSGPICLYKHVFRTPSHWSDF